MWHKTRRNKKKSIKKKRFVEQSDFKSFHLIFDLLRFITWSSHKLAGRIVADNSTWKSAETSCETSIIYRPNWDEISRKSSGRKWPIQSENGGGKAQFNPFQLCSITRESEILSSAILFLQQQQQQQQEAKIEPWVVFWCAELMHNQAQIQEDLLHSS